MSENWELVKTSELSKSFNVSNAYQIKPMSLCDVLTIFFLTKQQINAQCCVNILAILEK